MRRAIISDIHANLRALQAVLTDIESHREVDSIYCLGDVIGYGPDPRECLKIAQGLDLNLMGNHEEAVLFEPIGFNPKARSAIEWTKAQLNLPEFPKEENRDLWNFVGSMLERHVDDGTLFVHGSPKQPIREYIFVSDVHNKEKMDEIFAAMEQRVCFTGHTHIPGIFTENYEFHMPASVGNRYTLGEGRVIINVGSVGQPRDGDPRSSYVVYDGETIEFHRVSYDIEGTIQRYRETPELPEYLALRLLEGK